MLIMMMSWHENAYFIAGYLYEKSIGDWCIPPF